MRDRFKWFFPLVRLWGLYLRALGKWLRVAAVTGSNLPRARR